MPTKSNKQATSISLLIPLGLAVGVLVAPQATAGEKSWVQSHSEAVVNAYGECWDSSGTKELREECGDEMPQEVVETEAPAPEPMDSDGDGVPDSRDKCPDTRPGAKVDSDGCEIIENITINLDVEEFDFDSARLKPAMMSALDDVAARIAASRGNETLSVVGHTDSSGSETYNQGLSERRAQAVADYLAGQGVDSSRVSASGMGETSPIADNGTSDGRSRNRRVEINTN